MPTVTVADATLYYQEQGAGDPLVWAHGFTGTGERFAASHPALADRYRVVAPDLRGHGRTTGEPATKHPHAGFAADLIALLDHLGVERAHFVGHSAGAMSLLALGIRYPGRARTLTVIGVSHIWDERARAPARALPERIAAQPGWIDEQRRRHDATHGDDHWRTLLDTVRAWADDPDLLPFQAADVGAITCPTLVLDGDRDPLVPLELATALYRAIPNAELAILPAAGHAPHNERPDLFVPLLTDFLARHADA